MIEVQETLAPDPMSDVFTASMWSAPKNEPILRSFINAVRLDAGMVPIVQATVLNPFNIKEFVASKRIVLDVRVRDEQERLYDIEVQSSNHSAFSNRVLEYWSDTFSSQMKSGMDYTALRPVMSIILTEFSIFPQLKNIHNVFQITAKENPEVLLTKDFQIHFVRLSEVHKGHLDKLANLCRDLQDWVNFFVYAAKKTEREMSSLTNNNPIIREAYEEMQRFYANPETREKARQRRQFIFDYNLGMNASKTEGEARAILRLLTRRFGGVSQSLEEKLYSISDIEQLDRLTDLVLDSQTLEEFEESLG